MSNTQKYFNIFIIIYAQVEKLHADKFILHLLPKILHELIFVTTMKLVVCHLRYNEQIQLKSR